MVQEKIRHATIEMEAIYQAKSKIIEVFVYFSFPAYDIFFCSPRGWGLRSLDDIPAGGFICVYAGQLLTEQGANEVRQPLCHV